MKKIRLIEVKSELGAGTRGASLGPDAMRIAALNSSSTFYSSYESKEVPNENELLWSMNPTPNAKYIGGIRTMYERISASISEELNAGTFPFVIAGDHSSAGGTIAGIKAAYPNKRLGVVWVDAHADLHTPFTTPSGNVHGMPLAVSLGEDNLDCAMNPVSVEEKEHWDAMKNTGGGSPKIEAQDLVFIGVRDTEEPENYLLSKREIKNFTVAESRELGMETMAEKVLGMLSDCDMIYVSFDVDSLDSSISMGTGTPVKNGFTVSEMDVILSTLVASPKLVCFEVVEVNPTLDNQCNRMAEEALKLSERVIRIIEK